MVDVLHYNMNRIYDLWGIFLSHVLEVLASPKPALRSAAMEAVGTAINGALAEPASPAEPASVDSNGAARHPESSDSFEHGVEHMLLVALTALYTDDRDVDVRLGVLRVAITVLQRHGALGSCHSARAKVLVCRGLDAFLQLSISVCRGALVSGLGSVAAAAGCSPRAWGGRGHQLGLPVRPADVQRLHVELAS